VIKSGKEKKLLIVRIANCSSYCTKGIVAWRKKEEKKKSLE